MKSLESMTPAELAALFPIILEPHREVWRAWYAQENARLQALLPKEAVFRLTHIGSTAIDGIWAKPTVDMLLEATSEAAFATLAQRLAACGYICMHREAGRASFNRGYTPQGFAEEVFHLHLRLRGDADEIYFRDYLNLRPELAAQYERLKLSLWRPYEHDRDGYTAAKGEFIRRVTMEAKEFFQKRVAEGKGTK